MSILPEALGEYVDFNTAGVADGVMYKVQPIRTELRAKVQEYVRTAMALDHAYIELLYGRVKIGMSKHDYDYFWESPWMVSPNWIF